MEILIITNIISNNRIWDNMKACEWPINLRRSVQRPAVTICLFFFFDVFGTVSSNTAR